MTSKTTNKFSPEVRARAVRMVLDNEGDHASRWAAVVSIAEKIGCAAQTLHEWVKKAEVDGGKRGGVPAETADRAQGIGAGEPGAAPGQRDPTQGVGLFCPGAARPPVQAMIAFIDDHGRPTGSSRSARCCRSPRRPITSMWPSGAIPPSCRRGRVVTWS